MRIGTRSRAWGLATALVTGGALLAQQALAGGDACRELVVHEWGTFTSVQGAEGVALEGLQREEESLPPFVYSRSEVRECPLRPQGFKGLEVPVRGVTQKMETPVIYFHTKVPRRVRVRVDFVQGLISQWFPVSDTLGPPEAARDAGPLDLGQVERSFLEWRVDLLPQAQAPAELPPVSPDDPWSYAREVNAAWVRTVPREEPRLGPTEAERYLFYRGLGAFPLPLETCAPAPGVSVARNVGRHTIPAGFGLVVDPARRTIAWQPLQELLPGNCWKMSRAPEHLPPVPLEEGIAALSAAVQQALVAQGLFADEARAMVRTWARSWFGAPGTRILWLVPREVTDALLPLAIEPAPTSLVRVLVGRLELITPEVAAEVEVALRGRLSTSEAERAAAASTFARFGRLLEPHLRDVLGHTQDAKVRRSAEELLAALQ